MIWNIVSDSSCDLQTKDFSSDRVRFELVPLQIQVGEREILASDSEQLQKALIAAGVPCVLQSWPDMWHVFQMFPLKSAGDAMTAIADFLRQLA